MSSSQDTITTIDASTNACEENISEKCIIEHKNLNKIEVILSSNVSEKEDKKSGEEVQESGINVSNLKSLKPNIELSEGEITDDDDDDDGDNDIPKDFFDDFSKKEFLEGLDIPDTRENQSRSKRRRPRKRRRKRSRSSSKGRNRPRSRSRDRLRSLSREKSRSPYERKEERNRSEKELEKYRESFLQEIREKLNNIGNTAPPPAPTTLNVTHVVQIPSPVVSLQIPLPVHPQAFATSGIVKSQGANSGGSMNPQLRTQSINNSSNYEDFVAKLFTEKKISLSDYLTITAKREVKSSNSAQLQQKIKVISLCQDAIKLMSYKFRGPLKVQSSFDSESTNSNGKIQYQSPLFRNQIKFKYTSFNKHIEGDPFSNALHDILQRINVLSDNRDVNELINSVAEALINQETVHKEVVANILKISLLGATKREARSKPSSSNVSTQCMNEKQTYHRWAQTGWKSYEELQEIKRLESKKCRTWKVVS